MTILLRRTWFLGLLAAYQVAGAVPDSAAPLPVAPDFAVRIVLSESAKRVLLARSRSVIVQVSMADEIGPTGHYLAHFQRKIPGEATLAIRDIKFLPFSPKELSTLDYEVLIGAWLDGNAVDGKYLGCAPTLQDVISKLQHRVHEIHCDLYGEAPTSTGGSRR